MWGTNSGQHSHSNHIHTQSRQTGGTEWLCDGCMDFKSQVLFLIKEYIHTFFCQKDMHVFMFRSMCVCAVSMCAFPACRGRIIVDLQGLETMSRHTPGTHTQSVSQWNAANSHLMLPHRHCPPCSPGRGWGGSSETERTGTRVAFVRMISANFTCSVCPFSLH